MTDKPTLPYAPLAELLGTRVVIYSLSKQTDTFRMAIQGHALIEESLDEGIREALPGGAAKELMNLSFRFKLALARLQASHPDMWERKSRIAVTFPRSTSTQLRRPHRRSPALGQQRATLGAGIELRMRVVLITSRRDGSLPRRERSTLAKLNFWRRASDEDYVDFGRQQDLYEMFTGDRSSFLGYDRRFAAWLEKHPRNSLRPTRGD